MNGVGSGMTTSLLSPADFTQFLKACWAIERLKPLENKTVTSFTTILQCFFTDRECGLGFCFLSAESDAVTAIGTTLDILPFELKKVAET